MRQYCRVRAHIGKLGRNSTLSINFRHFVRLAEDVLGELLIARTLVDLSGNAMTTPVLLVINSDRQLHDLRRQASVNSSRWGAVE